MKKRSVRVAFASIAALSLLVAACGGSDDAADEVADESTEESTDESTTCTTPTPVKLQLQWFIQAQFAGYFAAQDQGFYEAQCLDVTIAETDIRETALVRV